VTIAGQGFDWEGWFTRPGMPARPDFDPTLAQQSDQLAEAWRKVCVCVRARATLLEFTPVPPPARPNHPTRSARSCG
jgi:hypothetical protein